LELDGVASTFYGIFGNYLLKKRKERGWPKGVDS